MTIMTQIPKKTVIGLTGNIGVGKSTVMTLLAELGAVGIDADQVAHQVMEPGQLAYHRVVARFGPQIAPDGGPIDRLRLGQIVFNDPAALADLEAIVHPAVFQVIQRRVDEADAPVVVIEAIKLLEAGLSRQLCHQVWVVTAPREQQIQRLMRSRNLSAAEAVLRIDAQPPQADKVAQADVVIENSGSLEDVRVQVEQSWWTLRNS
ncbi:MAG TPA: dephospho-CoA kinase [Anaerolineae bacterium]|nr:dephospho-CoA kinase [Anaerolineae bacterium]